MSKFNWVDVFFEVLRHDKKTRPRNYAILRGRYPKLRLQEFRANFSSFVLIISYIKCCRKFGKMKHCLWRYGQLKKFCVKDASRSLPHGMKRKFTFWNFLPFKSVIWKRKTMVSKGRATFPGTSRFASNIFWIYTVIWISWPNVPE